jgi:hypothetical protein
LPYNDGSVALVISNRSSGDNHLNTGVEPPPRLRPWPSATFFHLIFGIADSIND